MKKWMAFTMATAIACGIFDTGLHTVRTASAEPAAEVVCSGLQATISDDKNFYIFTATSSGDSSTITGYTFDFGDHESYRFTFAPHSSQDRHRATATHTYLNAGVYAPKVYVTRKHGMQPRSVTSDSCRTTVNIGFTPQTLPDAGFSSAGTVFAGSSLVATAAHHVWYRRRKTRIRGDDV